MATSRINGVRANFLRQFESLHGRQPTVTRTFLTDMQNKGQLSGPGTVMKPDGTAMELCWPAWLTNSKEFVPSGSRGVYELPWGELDAYDALVATREAEAAQKAKDAADRATAKALSAASVPAQPTAAV